jgi:S1-C subfamily serine protease
MSQCRLFQRSARLRTSVCGGLLISAALGGVSGYRLGYRQGQANWVQAVKMPQAAAHSDPAPMSTSKADDQMVLVAEPAWVGTSEFRADVTTAVSHTRRLQAEYGISSSINGQEQTDAARRVALQQLERRVALTISRAAESVVALEYSASQPSPGSRRLATGVVINGQGETLSVRIEPPRSGPVPQPGQSLPIIARDHRGHQYAAHWLAADSATGLTLLQLPPGVVRPICVAAESPNLGSQVFVVGNPFGMGHSVGWGHIASLDRAVELGDQSLGGLIQIEAAVYPGDSGAAVVNLAGDWLGVIRGGLAVPASGATGANVHSLVPRSTTRSADHHSVATTAMKTSMGCPGHEHEHDFGFAVPALDAVWIAEQLHIHGFVDRAYLGVRLEPDNPGIWTTMSPEGQRPDATPADRPAVARHITPVSKSKATLSDFPAIAATDGAVIHDVLPDTPAAKAGLQAGDQIVAIDGQSVGSTLDLIDRLDRLPAHTTIRLSINRSQGKSTALLNLSLHTGSRSDQPSAQQGYPATTRPTQDRK